MKTRRFLKKMSDKTSIHEILTTHHADLKIRFGIKTIGLFGSYVHDAQNKKSDIDILVEFEDGHNDIFNFLDLKEYLEQLFHKKVDLVMKDGLKHRIKDRILSEANFI